MKVEAAALWVITSYYNPAGYHRRRANFGAFRRNLAAPLLAIELSPDGRGELGDADADIVVRVRGDNRIWQKERLLNLAVRMLPAHVTHVAWIDADIVFDRSDWPERACAALDRDGGMVQLFDRARHLPEAVDPENLVLPQEPFHSPYPPGISIARTMREDCFVETVMTDWARQEDAANVRYGALGFAWAARRDTLEAGGLYEYNVIGGGDTVMVYSMVGKLDFLLENRPFTAAHQAHIRQWAARARAAGLLNHLGDIAQTAYHLWHGDIVNRKYLGRYRVLVEHDYDPARDVVSEVGQPLRWADTDGPLAAAVARYFFDRREDGG